MSGDLARESAIISSLRVKVIARVTEYNRRTGMKECLSSPRSDRLRGRAVQSQCTREEGARNPFVYCHIAHVFPHADVEAGDADRSRQTRVSAIRILQRN